MKVDFSNVPKEYWDDYFNNEPAEGVYSYPLETLDEAKLLALGARIAVGRPSHVITRLGAFVIDLSPESHTGAFKHAIDFLVPEGSRVLAAADGVVTAVVQHNREGGPTEGFAPLMNYLTISHQNDEFSQYCHLKPHSSSKYKVGIGTVVSTGQVIAEVGMTGRTDRPHLHFLVFRDDTPIPAPSRPTHHHSFAQHSGIPQGNPAGFKSLKVW